MSADQWGALLHQYIPWISAKVFTAWVSQEGNLAGGSGSNNPLNIGPGQSFATPQAGAQATADLLNTSGYYSGIRAVAGQSDETIIGAIGLSPWDAGHYQESGCTTPGCTLLKVYNSLFGGGGSIPVLGGVGDALGAAGNAAGGVLHLAESGVSTATNFPGSVAGGIGNAVTGALGSAFGAVGSALGNFAKAITSYALLIGLMVIVGYFLLREFEGDAQNPGRDIPHSSAGRVPAEAA